MSNICKVCASDQFKVITEAADDPSRVSFDMETGCAWS